MVGLTGRTLGPVALALVLTAGCSGDEEPGTSPPSSRSTTVEEQPEPVAFDETVAGVREVIDPYRDLLPGGVVLVRQGSEQQVLTWGFADTRRRTRLTGDSPFPVASITKIIVTVRALQLVEDGRLRLDDTVEEWLPDLLPTGDQVTVEQLLSHRAGLDDTIGTTADWPLDLDWTTSDLRRAVTAGRPDVTSHYSNIGFLIVGLIVEKAGGEPLERQLDEHVFAPAGMETTTLSSQTLDERRLVHGYDESDHDVTPSNDLSGAWAAGGVVSTARDLDRFVTALFSFHLLNESTVADMTETRGELDGDFSGSYGLGLWRWPFECGEALGHSGGIAGYRTEAFHNPDTDRTMILMVNSIDDRGSAEFVGNAALCPRP